MKCENCQNRRPVTTGAMTGFVRCTKASIGEYFAPEFERRCGLFLREVVAA